MRISKLKFLLKCDIIYQIKITGDKTIKMKNNAERKKIENAYKDLQHYYLKNEDRVIGLDDKPFYNLLELLYPLFSENPYYSDDCLVSALSAYVRRKNSVDDDLNELIEYINTIFDINKEKHFLVFPLQGSGLKRDIFFSSFYLIKEKDENDIIKQMSEITNIDIQTVRDFLRHTQQSRSKDFLKSNIMIIEVENQTENVNRLAYQSAQFSVDIFKLMHSAFGIKSSIFRMGEIWGKENSHVAILSKDNWRQGYGFSWKAQLQCKIDLDFMENKENQELFCSLFDKITKSKSDSLTNKFINAFMLYGKATVQKSKYRDADLALLLYITAVESLLTEGFNEKRLRISAIVPRLIDYKDKSVSEVSKNLERLYLSRNNFLHAGQSSFLTRRDDEMEFLDRVTALVLLKCFELDETIPVNGEKRTSLWTKYIDGIFKNIIFGM